MFFPPFLWESKQEVQLTLVNIIIPFCCAWLFKALHSTRHIYSFTHIHKALNSMHLIWLAYTPVASFVTSVSLAPHASCTICTQSVFSFWRSNIWRLFLHQLSGLPLHQAPLESDSKHTSSESSLLIWVFSLKCAFSLREMNKHHLFHLTTINNGGHTVMQEQPAKMAPTE